MLELAIGERVIFEDSNGQTQAGIVIRRNRKTVTRQMKPKAIVQKAHATTIKISATDLQRE